MENTRMASDKIDSLQKNEKSIQMSNQDKLTISKLSRESTDRTQVENLYLSAFPEIERHPIDELFDACNTGKCEWLIFKDGDTFIGMAYMVINDGIAFLLYLAVKDDQRNKGYGARILSELARLYAGKEVVLLIESLQEKCSNMDIRIRRKGFYLRNSFHDTGYIQSTCDGAAIYDILSTRQEFSTDRWKEFIAHYPMESYMDKVYK